MGWFLRLSFFALTLLDPCSSSDIQACLVNYYIPREFGSSPTMVGPLTPADEAYFSGSAGGCNLTGAELGNANNRRCSNICSNAACKLGGFQVRMLQVAAELGGFTFTLDAMPAMDAAGNIATNGGSISHTKTAFAHLKPSGPCDLWVSPFFITKARMQLGLTFSAPISQASFQLVRTTVKQQLEVEQSPILGGFQLYTTKVFSCRVWILMYCLYLFTRIMIYILELESAGVETWLHLCGPIYLPQLASRVALHVHTPQRRMSAYILNMLLCFSFIVALIYEAKMTDVLLTGHKSGEYKITSEEQCLVQDACCYSVELFDSVLSGADVRYTGKLRYVMGGEKKLWEEVTSGSCLAGLTTSTRLAKAFRTNGDLCGAIEPVPAITGLFSNFQAVPSSVAWAVRQDAPNAQNILIAANKGLAGAYGYAEVDRMRSIFGIYNQYYEKSSACVEQVALAHSKTSDMALSVSTFAIPFFLVTVMLCSAFIVSFSQSLPKSIVSDGEDSDEYELGLLETASADSVDPAQADLWPRFLDWLLPAQAAPLNPPRRSATTPVG